MIIYDFSERSFKVWVDSYFFCIFRVYHIDRIPCVIKGVKNRNTVPDSAMHATVRFRWSSLALVDNQLSVGSRCERQTVFAPLQTNVTYEEDVRLGSSSRIFPELALHE